MAGDEGRGVNDKYDEVDLELCMNCEESHGWQTSGFCDRYPWTATERSTGVDKY